MGPPQSGAQSQPTTDRQHGAVLRRVLLYGASRGTADALLALRGLVLARLLGPVAFGGWALFRLALRFSVFAGLGTHRGLEFEVARGVPSPPLWSAQLGFVLVVFGAMGALAFTGSWLVADPVLALGLRWFAAALLVEKVWFTGMVLLRARGELRRYATYEVVNAVLHLALAVPLAQVWGLAGAFGAFALATAISLTILARRVVMRPSMDPGALRRLIAVGFPVLLSLLLTTALTTADRWVVAAYGGARLLGLYSLAVAVAGLVASAGWVVRTVVFRDVFAGSARERPALELRDHLASTVLPFATLLPPLLGVGALALGPVIARLLPEYLESLPAARLFVFTGVTLGFTSLGALGVVAAGRQRLLPVLSGAALVVNVALSLGALTLGLGLEGVAAAALLSNAAASGAVLVLVARAADLPGAGRYLGRALLPMAWCVGAAELATRLRPGFDWAATIAALGLYLLFIVPLAGAMRDNLRRLRRAGAPGGVVEFDSLD